MFNSRVYSLKKKIELTVEYFKRRIAEDNNKFYIGQQYGEIKYITEAYIEDDNGKEVYADLSQRNGAEIVNLSILIIKIEDEFVSFKFGLIKTGLCINIINKLQTDNQVVNISFDHNNNTKGNEDFEKYKKTLSGFYRFELEKYL